MKTGVAIGTAGVLVAGILGAAWVRNHNQTAKTAPAATSAGELASLKQQLADAATERRTIERRAEDAYHNGELALETARKLRATLEEQEKQIASLQGLLQQRSAQLAAVTGEDGEPLASAVSAGLVISPDVAALAAGEVTPQAKAVVAEALVALRKEEEEERRVQREQRDQERRQRRMDELAERLNLQPYQTEQIAAIQDTVRAQREALFEEMRSGEADRSSIRDTMRAMRDDERTQIMGLLDPVQQEEYTKMQEERGGRFGGFGGRGNRGGGGGGGNAPQ